MQAITLNEAPQIKRDKQSKKLHLKINNTNNGITN